MKIEDVLKNPKTDILISIRVPLSAKEFIKEKEISSTKLFLTALKEFGWVYDRKKNGK